MNSSFPLLNTLSRTVADLELEFSLITADRRAHLAQLTQFVHDQQRLHHPINLNFICTHNSRRSHMAQLWAAAAAHYYGVSNVFTYSGGTEATAFNPNAVQAMKSLGFDIHIQETGPNPVYQALYAIGAPAIRCFSKRYDDPFNKASDFAAIMTCSHADENCPIITGAHKRIALTYDDPKAFDGTSQQDQGYLERAREIGRELLFAFSHH